jgi:hypothetical protein
VAIGERTAAIAAALSDHEKQSTSRFSDIAASTRRTMEAIQSRIAVLEEGRAAENGNSTTEELEELRNYIAGLASTLAELVNIPLEVRDLTSRVNQALGATFTITLC